MEHISAYTEEKAKQLSRGPKFVRWAVMLGIVVALNIFFIVIRGLAFPEPSYSDFCSSSPIATPATTPEQSDAIQAVQTHCNDAYQKAENQYQLEGFVLLIGLGVLAIIVGVLPLGSSIVSSGLSYGGVLSFIIGSAQYWGNAGSWLRLAISLIALGALIYIGIKRFHD